MSWRCRGSCEGWGNNFRRNVGEGLASPGVSFAAAPNCASALALPVGELSAQPTERVSAVAVDPLRPSLRSDTAPKGGGKGVHHADGLAEDQGFPSGGSCRRSRLMRGGVLAFEMQHVFEPKRSSISKRTTLLLIRQPSAATFPSRGRLSVVQYAPIPRPGKFQEGVATPSWSVR